MCGIFGLIVSGDADYGSAFIKKSLTTLAQLSESRGKDSSGFAFRNEADKTISVIRASMPISSLMKHRVSIVGATMSIPTIYRRVCWMRRVMCLRC